MRLVTFCYGVIETASCISAQEPAWAVELCCGIITRLLAIIRVYLLALVLQT